MSDASTNVYSALTLCHGVYVAEFDQLKGPTVLLDRPKSFDNARLRQIMGSLPRQTNSGVFSSLAMPNIMSTTGMGVAGTVFETQNRLMETADRIARRLLAGSVGDSSDFLELQQEDAADGDDCLDLDGGTGGAGEPRETVIEIMSADDARDKRHSFFSTFLDAVPVSRLAGHATFVDVAGAQQPTAAFFNNASFSLTSAAASSVAGAIMGSSSPSSPVTSLNSTHSGKEKRASFSLGSGSGHHHVIPRVYVQNDAGLETCVVCACTFAVPDVYARGFRRDVTIFAICPRVGWGTISPRVSEALRVFGSRVCDNAMSVFYSDLKTVTSAVSKAHAVLQLEHRLRQWQDGVEKKREEEAAAAAAALQKKKDGNAAVSSGVSREAQTEGGRNQDDEEAEEEMKEVVFLLPKLERVQMQQEHFKRRRTEEEFQSLLALSQKLQIIVGKDDGDDDGGGGDGIDEQHRQGQTKLPQLSFDHTDVSALSKEGFAEIQSVLSLEENKIAAHCRNRGHEPLRVLADLCPSVWEEEAPTSEQESQQQQQQQLTSDDASSTTATSVVAGTGNDGGKHHHSPSSSVALRSSQLECAPVSACGARHWEAAQVLLSRFAPVFLPPISPSSAAAAGGSVYSSVSSAVSATSSGAAPHNNSSSSSSSSVGAGAAFSLTGAPSSSSQSSTSAVDSAAFSNTMSSATNMNLHGHHSHHHHHHHHPHGSLSAALAAAPSMITFQFGGKVHETRWSLRGYLFMPVPEISSPHQHHQHQQEHSLSSSSSSDYARTVAHLRPLLPSVFLRAQESFPKIVSVAAGAATNSGKSANNNSSSGKSAQQQLQHQQQLEAASRKKIHERSVMPFFTDAPGQFYRKYKSAVENTLPVAARECVLPTVAFFPSFSSGRY